MSRRRFIPALAAVLALAVGVAACGGGNDSTGSASSSTPSSGSAQAAAIKHNDANAKTTITVGSKNFTEQKVLGEIYAQAFQAAGYTRQEGAQPRRREDGAQGGQDRPDLRLPGVHRHRPAVVPEGPGQGHPDRRGPGLRAGQGGPGQAGHRGLPADPVHLVQRGRPAQEEGRRARGHEDLRPQAQGRPAHPLRLARVPHAPGLPAGPREGLRPEVQEVRARSTSTSATRC